jgi:hypothetical protein
MYLGKKSGKNSNMHVIADLAAKGQIDDVSYIVEALFFVMYDVHAVFLKKKRMPFNFEE